MLTPAAMAVRRSIAHDTDGPATPPGHRGTHDSSPRGVSPPPAARNAIVRELASPLPSPSPPALPRVPAQLERAARIKRERGAVGTEKGNRGVEGGADSGMSGGRGEVKALDPWNVHRRTRRRERDARVVRREIERAWPQRANAERGRTVG